MKKFKKLIVILLACSLITASFAGMTMAAQKTGWKKTDDGWVYVQKDGTNKTGWLKDGGKWYYLTENGIMASGGNYVIKRKGYLFDNNGVWISAPGWHKIKNIYGTKWYYIKSSGVCKNGWLKDGENWYFLDYGYMVNSGVADTNLKYEEGKEHVPDLYAFNADGTMVTKEGWVKQTYEFSDYSSYTLWYYAKSDGKLVSGWKKINGTWYFFNGYRGNMLFNSTAKIGKKVYLFEKNGALTSKTGWQKVTCKYDDGKKLTYWYYLKKGGVCQTGWKKIKGKWYYFDTNGGYMYAGSTFTIKGKEYTFNAKGVWKK